MRLPAAGTYLRIVVCEPVEIARVGILVGAAADDRRGTKCSYIRPKMRYRLTVITPLTV